MRRTKFLPVFRRCPFRIRLGHRTSVVVTWFLSVSPSTCWHSLWKIMQWLSFSTSLAIAYSLPCHSRQIVCLNYCRPRCANCKFGYRELSNGQRAAVLYSHVLSKQVVLIYTLVYRVADKSLAWPTSRRILFDGENISFDASLVYINSTNVPPIMIINRIYEHQNLLSL